MSESRISWLGALVTAAILSASSVSADQLNCDLDGYAAAPGLTAAVEHDTLTVVWDGDNRQSLRMRFVISAGTPTIRELAVRPPAGGWRILATNVTPDVRVVTGTRRVTMQQLWPLRQNGIELTQPLLSQIKWEAFWDAPLMVPGAEWAHGNATPPPEPFLWGDGQKTSNKVVSTKDLLPFGSKSFAVPFDATGAKWVRVAAWDSAGNGAMTQPIAVKP